MFGAEVPVKTNGWTPKKMEVDGSDDFLFNWVIFRFQPLIFRDEILMKCKRNHKESCS